MSSIKKNTVYNVIKTFSNIAFPMITFPYVSRVLLPENVGKYNFANTYVSYFALIASLGIATYAIRECSKVRDNKKEMQNVASQIYSINLCTTFVAYILLFFSLIFFHSIKEYRLLIVISSTTLLFTTIGADWINVAMEDFSYITLRTIVFQMVSLALMFLFVKTPDDYIKYATISVVSSSGANLCNFFYRKKICTLSFTLHIEWKRHMIPIMFLFVMVLSQTIFSSADVTMLGLYKGDYEVGIYSTAIKVERLISQVVSSIVYVLIPRLSYLFSSDDYKKINEMLRKVLGTILLIGIPCFAGAFILSEEIILIIAGAEYMKAVPVMQIAMFSFLFSLVGGSFLGNIVLLPSGNEKKYMIICCIAAAVNVITNYLLIPIYGAKAAAGTTAFSSFLIMIMLIFSVDKEIRISDKVALFIAPTMGGIGIMTSCLILKRLISSLHMRTFVCVVCGVLIYFFTVIVMKNEFIVEIMNEFLAKLKGKREDAE